MEVDWLIRIVLLIISLIFSAFFSGSEVALFSIDTVKIKELKKQQNIFNRHILNLLEYPRRLLVTILLGNTIFNVAASIIAVSIALDAAASLNISVELAILAQIILLTLFVLIVGEITPKVWAAKYPLGFSKLVSIPLYWISVLLYPIAKILTDLIKFVGSKFNISKGRTALFSSEIHDLADISLEKGTIEEGEQELIQGIVSFKTVTVREVMTPRVDMITVAHDTKFDDLMKIVTDSGHSRIPLFKNNIDEIEGVIYAKDLLPYLGNNELRKSLSLTKIARKALFIPENKLISELMRDFQEKNMHIGIVVDEYGGTAGLISMEDILEEIVGEIQDEYDNDESEITKISDREFLVLGKVSIDEINELMNDDITSENDDYDTIAGFIFNQVGAIPKENDVIEFRNVKYTVKEIEHNRINKVLIEIN